MPRIGGIASGESRVRKHAGWDETAGGAAYSDAPVDTHGAASSIRGGGVRVCRLNLPNRRIRDPVCPVVWEGGAVRFLPIPIWAQRVAQVCPPSAEDRVSDRTLNLPALQEHAMHQYEVIFSLYQNAAGTVGVANMTPGRTVVTARNIGEAQSQVKAMYASFPKVILSGCRQL